MKRIEVSLIEVVLDIFKELVLGCDLMVSFDVVDHLNEVMRDAFEVDLARDRGPSEMEVVNLGVL